MRLKAHREDLTTLIDLSNHGYGKLAYIAARYKRLIELVEEADKLYYQGIYTDKARKVIEDAEGK